MYTARVVLRDQHLERAIDLNSLPETGRSPASGRGRELPLNAANFSWGNCRPTPDKARHKFMAAKQKVNHVVV